MNEILLFQRIVPHYRVPVFRLLSQKLNIRICASDIRNSSLMSFISEIPTGIKLKYIKIYKDKVVYQFMLKLLMTSKPNIVICETSLLYLTFWTLLICKYIFRYKIIGWTHGIDNKEFFTRQIFAKRVIRKIIYKYLDAIILYDENRKKIIEQEVSNPEKVFYAKNTLDNNNWIETKIKYDRYGLNNIKNDLKIRNQLNVCYVGSMIKGKRLDIIIDIFNHLSGEYDIGLHLFGEGDDITNYKDILNKNKNIYYYGFQSNTELLLKTLYICEIILNPGPVGLSVVQGFSLGTPIITCVPDETGPFHGPEYSYIIHNYNGMIVENNLLSLIKAMKELLCNPKHIRSLSDNAFITAKDSLSIENMLAGFQSAINYVSKKK